MTTTTPHTQHTANAAHAGSRPRVHAAGRAVLRALAWTVAAVCAVALLVGLAYIVWVFGLVVVKALVAIPFGHAMG